MLKNILLKILNILSVLIIVISIGVLLTVVMTKSGEAPNFLGYSLFRVMTGSMEPGIPTDSLIIVQRTDPSKLAVGDVISFYSRDPSLRGEVNTHRIVAMEKVEKKLIFRTKGDANNIEDQYLTQEEDVIGRVIFSSRILGKIVRLISNPLIFVPLIILPLAILLGQSVWESISLARKISREEEEKAVREAVEAIRQKRKNEMAAFDVMSSEGFDQNDVSKLDQSSTTKRSGTVKVGRVKVIKPVEPEYAKVRQAQVRQLEVKAAKIRTRDQK